METSIFTADLHSDADAVAAMMAISSNETWFSDRVRGEQIDEPTDQWVDTGTFDGTLHGGRVATRGGAGAAPVAPSGPERRNPGAGCHHCGSGGRPLSRVPGQWSVADGQGRIG
ncbi:hypothetical protein CCP4SC76_5280013 [Gammaproteobacteria bacterium]